MAVTYVKTEITDEGTDADSPVTETLMQDMGQSINYLLDGCFEGGLESENLDISASIALTNPADMDMYVSSWVSIADSADHDFAHGLGRTPTVVLPMHSDSSGGTPMIMIGSTNDTVGTGLRVTTIDGTNVTIDNDAGGPQYCKVVCW